MSRHTEKTYLGDGAYAEFDHHGFLLTAENGIEVTDKVYLDVAVLHQLIEYAIRCGVQLPLLKAEA